MNVISPPQTGPTLFHYTDAAGLVGIIRNREVWATGSNYLNDPTEVVFAAAALRARLRSVHTDPERVSAALDVLETYIDPHSPDQYQEDRSFITSFSRSDQNLTLWRLYGGSGGFCIGFDERHLLRWIGHDLPAADTGDLNVAELEELHALRANYQLSARIDDVSYGEQHIGAILAAIMEVPLDLELSHLRVAMNNLSGIKHLAFEDEREARLIIQESHHSAVDPQVRVSASGGLLAYRRVVFPFEAIQSVTMAPGANVPQQRRALQALMAQGGRAPYSHVDIRECDLPFVW